MKTITKLIYTAFAVVSLAIGAATANGAPNDLFASINGTGDNGGGSIYEYTPSGVKSIFASALSRPRGVAFDQAANLFVATMTCVSGTCQGAIVKITPAGVQSTFATLSQQNFQPEGLAFDVAGNLFVMAINLTDPNLVSTIYKFTPNGVQSTFGSVTNQGFGLAFDSAGNLFAGSGDQNIYKFTPDGTRSVFVGASGFPPNNGPIDLAFDRFGNLFASTESGLVNDPSNVVLKFTPDGVGSTFAANLGNYPRGLAFNRGGQLYVAEVGENPSGPSNGDILKFSPDGTRSTFVVVPGAINSGPEFLTFFKK